MAYVTRSDLVDRFGEDEVAQRESMLPAGAVDKAIADASATADDYLAGRYAVPVVPVPDTLKRLVCDIARYYLLGDSAEDEQRRRHGDALTALRDIGAGRRRFGVEPVAGGGAAATVEIASSPRVFRRPL